MSSIHSSVSVDFCLILIFTRFGFQIYEGQGSFLDKLLITNFSNPTSFLYGMPIDNLSLDTSLSASGL